MKTTTTHQTQWVHPVAWLRSLVGLALVVATAAAATSAIAADNRAPEVPAEIALPGTTNVVHFHGYAEGVQIYTWNGNDWGNAVPRATLFDDDGNVVIAHFGTPNGR